MNRTIFHVDMDAFYAAVEQRDNPTFRGKPVIVGADPREGRGRGVVATCSYEARRYGIHSALPIGRAYRLCPQGIFVRPNFEKYRLVSEQVRQIFGDFSTRVEPVSIDEAFLDVSDRASTVKEVLQLARTLKQRIFKEQQLTASVGVAPNKFVGKIASDLRKPNGLLMIREREIQRFLDPLPVSRIWGVGPRTENRLKEMGIETIVQLRNLTKDLLLQRFGKLGGHLLKLANGIDHRPVVVRRETKSVSNEHTFREDVSSTQDLEACLQKLSQRVSDRLRKHHLAGKIITLKLRYSDFTTITRQKSLRHRTSLNEEIRKVAFRLFYQYRQPSRRIRLLGVGVSNLAPDSEPAQLQLF